METPQKDFMLSTRLIFIFAISLFAYVIIHEATNMYQIFIAGMVYSQLVITFLTISKYDEEKT